MMGEIGFIKQLFLDTKGTCFLCLQELENVSSKESTKKDNVCLRSLCRYLNISPCSVLRRGLEGNLVNYLDNAGGRDQCDFSVTLCTCCAFVVKELGDLKRQQEIINMLLEYHVKILNQILEQSEDIKQERNLWSKLQEKMRRNIEDLVETRLVEQLRMETRQKCALKMKMLKMASFPMVKIDQIPNSNQPTKLNNPVFHEVYTETEKSDSDAPPVLSPQNLFDCSTNSSSANVSTDELLENILSAQCKKVGSSGRNTQCPFCKIVVFDGRRGIRAHLLNGHTEQFLVGAKRTNVSEEKFRDYCNHLMFMETKNAQSAGPCNIPYKGKNKPIICVYCKTVCYGGYRLRAHLVLKHGALMEPKLTRLMETPCPNPEKFAKARWNATSRSHKSSVWICDFASGGCGHKFSRKYHLNMYKYPKSQSKKLSCPATVDNKKCELKFFSSCALARHKMESGHRSTNVTENNNANCKCHLESGGCGRMFSNKDSLIRHEKRNCPRRKYAPRLTTTEEQRRMRQFRNAWQQRSCAECGGRRFASRKALLEHLKQAHQKKNRTGQHILQNSSKEKVLILESKDIPSSPKAPCSLSETASSSMKMKQDGVLANVNSSSDFGTKDGSG